MALEQIEKDLAAARRRAAQNNNAARAVPESVTELVRSDSRDAIGEHIGVSGVTATRLIRAAKAINTLREQGREADALQVETALNTGGASTGDRKQPREG